MIEQESQKRSIIRAYYYLFFLFLMIMSGVMGIFAAFHIIYGLTLGNGINSSVLWSYLEILVLCSLTLPLIPILIVAVLRLIAHIVRFLGFNPSQK